jgi:hypothetical protein
MSHWCKRLTRLMKALTLARLPGVARLSVWVVALQCVFAASAFAAVPNPTVSGPIPSPVIPGDVSHNYTFFSTTHDLATNGYVEEEYFFQGTANRYTTPPLTTATILDGGHPYVTRMVVRRPVDPAKFNGTVLVEWINVTNGFDAENTWFFSWEHILRSGYVWVGVSAQRVGVDAMKAWSPNRYGTLDVTTGGTINNDALSYDIYSQAGQAIRAPGAVDVLDGLKPKVVIAMGESQSASRLATYANSIQPLANVYDGVLLLSALGNPIRTDSTVPVFKVLTEFDVGALEAAVRQPDTSMFRTWEVVGTSHVDYHLRQSREALELRDLGTSSEAALHCGVPTIGTRVPTQYVLAAADDAMVRWITTGTPPPTAPRIEIASFSPTVIARDSLGLALGGIRLSQLAVPTAYNVGFNTGPGACNRWGYYIPFDIPMLDQLYPSHNEYVKQVRDVTHDNLQSGFILSVDADATVNAADASAVGAPNNHK